MKGKVQIKSVFGKLIFEWEAEDNSIKETLLKAIKNNANLSSADLYGADLSSADLYGANLSSANLRSADLSSADLYGANLSSANLYGANLSSANLYGANLSSANLRSANLSSADLSSADLYGADLYGADLYGANLRSANLSSADLSSADLKKIVSVTTIVPEGDLIVWKKLQNNLIAQLLIPSKAKRVNAIGSRKCRFEFVKTLAIFDGKKKVKEGIGKYDGKTIYKVGELTYPDEFDPSPLIECSHGIHAFITKQEAIDY
jgi:hypothetical protein